MVQPNPIRKLRAGAVFCAIWRNDVNVAGRTVPMLKASVERRYQATDGTWKSSGSFTRNEIPLVMHVLQQAFELMIKHENAAKENESNDLAA